MTTARMASGPEIRPLLPHTMPVHGFSFGPAAMGLTDHKKSKDGPAPHPPHAGLTPRTDYVFVDEHNRHKRLKGTWCPALERLRSGY